MGTVNDVSDGIQIATLGVYGGTISVVSAWYGGRSVMAEFAEGVMSEYGGGVNSWAGYCGGFPPCSITTLSSDGETGAGTGADTDSDGLDIFVDKCGLLCK